MSDDGRTRHGKRGHTMIDEAMRYLDAFINGEGNDPADVLAATLEGVALHVGKVYGYDLDAYPYTDEPIETSARFAGVPELGAVAVWYLRDAAAAVIYTDASGSVPIDDAARAAGHALMAARLALAAVPTEPEGMSA